jgi:hypothetical protein
MKNAKLSTRHSTKMGTRSRLVIFRKYKKEIRLWMHWDGYFDGVGNDLAEQVKTLLEKYSYEQIVEMIESINIDDESSDFSTFKQTDLVLFIEGKTDYSHNNCDDVEYTYTLDIYKQMLYGRHDGTNDLRGIPFSRIRDGKNFSDCIDTHMPTRKVNVFPVAPLVEPHLVEPEQSLTVKDLVEILQRQIDADPSFADVSVYHDSYGGTYKNINIVKLECEMSKSAKHSFKVVLS